MLEMSMRGQEPHVLPQMGSTAACLFLSILSPLHDGQLLFTHHLRAASLPIQALD